MSHENVEAVRRFLLLEGDEALTSQRRPAGPNGYVDRPLLPSEQAQLVHEAARIALS